MVTEASPVDPPPTTDATPRRRRPIRAAVTAAVVAAALAHPVASALSRYDWLADLVSHFQGPALAASVLAALVTARRHRRLALGLVVLAGFQVPPLLRYGGANPVRPDPRSSERLRIVVANVRFDNVQYDVLARLIRLQRPDVVALVEYGPEWRGALAGLRDEYPYVVEHASGHRADGMALWSRIPFEKVDPPEWLVPRGNCVIHASLAFARKERHLWVVHPTSPLYRVGRPGNAELEAIARRVRDTGGSRVVVGDLNCTDGSAHFHDLLRVSGLRDSRLGFGRQPSWPTGFPYRIAIDHALVSDDLAVVGRRLGPNVGSDHFPFVVDLAPVETNSEAQSSQSPASSP
jgi:endonuclease/exonuclease/phosphatase (EEP) superfamily protein YafD